MTACVRSAGKSVRLACGVAFIISVAFSAALSGQSAPTVSLTSPTSGSVITGTVTTTAVTGAGVAGVQFMLDNAPLGTERTVAPYAVNWSTRGSTDLIFGVAKITVGPMTIGAGSGFTKRLGVSCPGCTGDDTVSVDRIQSAPGAAGAAFTFSGSAHYVAHMAAFKAAATPLFRQGTSANSNTGSTTIARAFATAIAPGSLIVAAVAWTGSAPLTVTDNRNNVYAAATTAYDPALGQSLAIVYAANAAAGATTVTARFGMSATVRRLEIHEYAGIATASPLDATSTNTAAGTTTPGSVTSGSATTTVTAAATNGSHTLTAVARDASGHHTTSAPVTVTVDNDPAPPVISTISASSITAFGATINWVTNEPGTSQVDYGPTTAYASTTALNPGLVTTHAVSLGGLAASTLYHVRVRSRDAAGNLAVSGDVTLTTLEGAAPTVSVTAPAGGATVSGVVAVTATASDNVGVAGVQFRLDGAALGAEDTSAPYSTSWNTATAANGSHTLTAIARDAAGNQTTSAAVTVTINNDTTPPVISAVGVSSILSSAATISWTTDEASDSKVEYGVTTAYGELSTLDASLATAHRMVLGNLAPSALYHFRVRSRDVAGNLALSGDLTFTTLDGIPPSVSITAPAIGSIVSGTITVTASAADNVGVAGVQFQLDGVPLGAEDTTAPFAITWNTTGQLPGLHALTAVARDMAGNQTTSAIMPVTVASAGQVTLAWDASLDPALTGYKVYVGAASGVYTVSVVDVGNVTTCTITGLQPGAVYYIAVTAYDDSGNEGGFSNEISTTVP